MNQPPLFPAIPRTLTVSQVTRHIRATLEDDADLQDLWVQGEVYNLSRPRSGHVYFTLKDSNAAIRCVMWRSVAERQTSLPQDGEQVEVHGHISVYEAGGQYQLYADRLRPLGAGVLYEEFLRLRDRLEAEGLFDPDRKRPLPQWPRRLGLVTSPTGAALQDMLNTLRRRYPLVEVILAPTPVQGEGAPPGIVNALQALNRVARPDVILLARGGGSMEDLWAFNDERVARAIAASHAPVVTGVGHETDFTIADFVADLRAPTPTAAAEMATPHRDDLRQALDETLARLGRSFGETLTSLRRDLVERQARLQWHSPHNRIQSERQNLDELARRSSAALAHRLRLQRAHVEGAYQRLSALNPESVLERGYAMVSDENGQLVSRTSQAKPGQPLDVRVQDGTFGVRVTSSPHTAGKATSDESA